MRSSRFGVLLMGAWGALACGYARSASSEDDCPIPSNVGCAQPLGIYSATYTERAGGTCGAKDSTEVRVVRERVLSFRAPCSGDVAWSDDFCMASFEATCPEDEVGPGYRNEQISHTTYSEDALTRTGVFELSIFDADGNPYCHSVYDSVTRNTSCD